jgi:hypothetical protein
MARQAARIWGALAGLFLLLGSPAAAVPIEVSFSLDGVAYGQFAFEGTNLPQRDLRLTSGSIAIGDRVIGSANLLYDYSPIQDSLNIRIFGNETTGLNAGESFGLTFGNDGAGWLELPTYGSMGYQADGISVGGWGTVTAVPEPLSVSLFGAAAGALVWRRRRRAVGDTQPVNA